MLATWRTTDEVFRFAFDGRFRVPLGLVGVTPSTAWVRVADGGLQVRFGPWALATPLGNIAGTEVTGPFSVWRGIGTRLSLADRGLTFSTNVNAGLCVRFREPVPGLEPTGLLRHPGVTLTVADPDALARALAA
ncbi:hypothetical protein [Actinokineospora sp. NBRC 105648]|uniref:hypothetical protein n=1 Tax=Actinokineospora sp. NBRC 105648 TaxID=3032206 RepID=UPI0024A41852|nr:hypothetical protein [Actinokineospora sp. NBRC 105648]GLZ38009.1 hypothetical protein Acsp05_16330 [Actinokineospora sp. NBRC 105648]